MTRQTQREIARINRLADYIEANAYRFNQEDPRNCIVGMGGRVYKGKSKLTIANMMFEYEFAPYFGVSVADTASIFNAQFGKVVKGFGRKNWKATPKYAVRFLRALAEQKALDKTS